MVCAPAAARGVVGVWRVSCGARRGGVRVCERWRDEAAGAGAQLAESDRDWYRRALATPSENRSGRAVGDAKRTRGGCEWQRGGGTRTGLLAAIPGAVFERRLGRACEWRRQTRTGIGVQAAAPNWKLERACEWRRQTGTGIGGRAATPIWKRDRPASGNASREQ